MELDPDAIQAAIDRAVEKGRRTALASALRFQALALEATGEAHLASAKQMRDEAARVERGANDQTIARRSAAPEPGQVGRVLASKPHEVTGEREYAGVGNIPLSKAMREFIESFHPRYRDSDYFVTAVNRAAEAGCFLNDETAHMIAGQIQEREELERAETSTERSTDG